MKNLVRFLVLGALLTIGALLVACSAPAAVPPTQAAATQAPATAAPAAATNTTAPTVAPKEKVTVATDATWAPFEYLDESTKKIVGFDIDLMDAIAAKANLDVTYTNVAWDPLLAGMAQCQYDAAISSMSITDDRKKLMLFSDPYFQVGQVVVVATGNTAITGKDSLTGKKIGSQISTTGAIEAGKIKGATVKTYDDISLSFQDLINGQIDAVITDNALAVQYIKSNPGKVKMVGEAFTGEDIGIAICKTKTDLQTKINAALKTVKAEGLMEKLNTKWLKGS
jgi:polar amino acid transport system substrate-binding protein